MNKFFASIVIFAVGALALFGMQMEANGHGMVHCPFMASQSAMCDMTPFAHAELWQTLFLIVVKTSAVLFLLAIVLWRAQSVVHTDGIFQRWRRRFDFSVGLLLYSYFSWLFSDGILHPKSA